MTTKFAALKDELTKDHWMWSYSWRGVRLDQIEKQYKLPRAEILSVMREIAHAHDPPRENIKALPRCRSCGMRIVWGKSVEKRKASRSIRKSCISSQQQANASAAESRTSSPAQTPTGIANEREVIYKKNSERAP